MKTFTSLQLSDLTPEQLAYFNKYIWNGVGSRHFFINPHDLIFKEASKYHDLAYWVGGCEGYKRQADERFLKNCLEAVRRQPVIKRFFYLPVAYLYYTFLILLGSYAFEYSDKPCQTWAELLNVMDVYWTKYPEERPDEPAPK